MDEKGKTNEVKGKVLGGSITTTDNMHYNLGNKDFSVSFWFPPLPVNRGLEPEKIIFNDRKTIVIWNDNTKTVSTCMGTDYFDENVGFAMCLLKKMFGKKVYGKKLYKRMIAKAVGHHVSNVEEV